MILFLQSSRLIQGNSWKHKTKMNAKTTYKIEVNETICPYYCWSGWKPYFNFQGLTKSQAKHAFDAIQSLKPADKNFRIVRENVKVVRHTYKG